MTFAKGLVAAQIALSLLLVVGAGLFLRTLWNLQSVALGYSKEKLLLVSVDALTGGYSEAQRPTIYNEIADRLRILPGVRAVTYSENGLIQRPQNPAIRWMSKDSFTKIRTMPTPLSIKSVPATFPVWEYHSFWGVKSSCVTWLIRRACA